MLLLLPLSFQATTAGEERSEQQNEANAANCQCAPLARAYRFYPPSARAPFVLRCSDHCNAENFCACLWQQRRGCAAVRASFTHAWRLLPPLSRHPLADQGDVSAAFELGFDSIKLDGEDKEGARLRHSARCNPRHTAPAPSLSATRVAAGCGRVRKK